MTHFPDSALKIKEIAIELVRYLKGRIMNTKGSPKIWTARNLKLLDEFCRNVIGIDPIYSGTQTGPECLWDFVGYIKDKGMLLTAESEFDPDHDEIAKDFDKLLYGTSPLKLMIRRIDTGFQTEEAAFEEAESIRRLLEENIQGNCVYYPPGSVFVLYCVWWAEAGGANRDFPYILQIDGKPHYTPVACEQHLEPVLEQLTQHS
jgi:hypothetical protein